MPKTTQHPPPPPVGVDLSAYRHFFDDSDIPEEQKEALLQALWSVMMAFVDLGFGVHPIQQACGQTGDPNDAPPKDPADPLYCDLKHLAQEQIKESGLTSRRSQEGVDA